MPVNIGDHSYFQAETNFVVEKCLQVKIPMKNIWKYSPTAKLALLHICICTFENYSF